MGSLPEAVPLAPAPRVRVFIAGGSYAGLSTALNLLDLAKGLQPRMARETYTHHPHVPLLDLQITIADERDGFFHLIGAPLALADEDYSRKAWVRFQDIPALSEQSGRVKFVQGSVTSVDPEARTATVVHRLTGAEETHEYDYFVAATGLRRAWPVVPQSLGRKQYLTEAGEHIRGVSSGAGGDHGVVVVGGGAVGIEMAAELKLVKPDVRVTLVHSREKLLSSEGLPDETKDRALELLREAGVEVLLGHRLASSKEIVVGGVPRYEVFFTNGTTIVASQVVMAMSNIQPTTSYLPRTAVNDEGYVKILPNLGFAPGTPNAGVHFCGGDAAQWSGIKRCGGALHHGNLIAQNIHQIITMRQLLPRESHLPRFQELPEVVPPMIGLAVGKKAVAYGPEIGTVSGEDVMTAYFRDDLGFEIIWNYLQLGGRKEEEAIKA